MSLLPEDEPFGVATGLKPPSSDAVSRAKPLFEKFLSGEARSTAPLPASQFGGGRRYDVAMALVAALPGSEGAAEAALPEVQVEVEADPIHEEVTRVVAPLPSMFSDEVTQMLEAPLPARPPAGVPMVRKSAPQAPPSAPVANALLEQTVDTALFWQDPDGAQTFELAFKDEVFDAVSCSLTVVKGRVTATFRVLDDNQRRLLEAEAGTLRVALEQRGLRVDDIKVVLE